MEISKNNNLTIFLILTFICSIMFIEVNTAQQVNRIYEDIGGGSGTTNTSVNSNDDTILYVVGGAVIVGVVIYALLNNKKETEKSKQDTTAVNIYNPLLSKNLLLPDQTANANLEVPINLSFGMQRDKFFNNEKRYYLGLSYNF